MAFDPRLDCDLAAVERSLTRGLSAFGVADPVAFPVWAEDNFYLSAESSYVEQQWKAWPFQRGIMAAIGNDAIQEVDFMKSARVGWTKMLLAAIGYFAQHKRRNQALWQPTDDDRDEFVKAELDSMLRDVAIMRDVLPAYKDRHKDNTLLAKKFIGSMLYLRGGKAAKNYRRISVDVAMLDEIDAFDSDIEKEGDPVTLAAKRIEGATFPKLLVGSTPKLRGFSLVEARRLRADARYEYQIQCPDCEGWHALTWWGDDQPHGFKWTDDDPESVRHLCPHCGSLIDQGQFLAVAAGGRWVGDDGSSIDDAGLFRDAAGVLIPPHPHVAFHVWTAYSPAVSWSSIVREYLAAREKADEGDENKLKAFINTTLGLSYEGDIERTDAEELKQRAEPFPLRLVPRDCLLLLAGVDVQDNRVEIDVWGFGRGSQMWTIDHQVLYGNPAEEVFWHGLAEFLTDRRYPHVCGTELQLAGAGIDSGGHHTQAVYSFVLEHKRLNVFALKGRSASERHIKDGASQVDIDWRGRRRKRGVLLWHVGTNHAKDLLHSRLQVTKPGPGYVHLSSELPDEWFRQLAGEVRATRRGAQGLQSRWSATRKRVEALDMAVYALWLEAYMDLGRKSATWWDQLEEKVQPANGDLFAPAMPAATTVAAVVEARPPAQVVAVETKARFSLGGRRFGGSSAAHR